MMGGAVLVALVEVAHGFAFVLLRLQCPGTLGDPKTLIDCTMLGQKPDASVGLPLEESSGEGFQKEAEMGWRVVFGNVTDLEFE